MPIIHFDNEQTNIIKKNWCHLKKVGEGAEAGCYLDGDDVYKVYNDKEQNHCINNTICKEDLDLESILFPNEIFMCDGKVFAYKTKYIDTDYFGIEKLHYGETPDIYKLKDALIPFIKDIYVLSKENISLDDLSINTMFDGEKLYAIDTLAYKKHDTNQFDTNIEHLKDVIRMYKQSYEFYFEYNNTINEEFKKQLDELIPYIDEIAKQTQEEIHSNKTK